MCALREGTSTTLIQIANKLYMLYLNKKGNIVQGAKIWQSCSCKIDLASTAEASVVFDEQLLQKIQKNTINKYRNKGKTKKKKQYHRENNMGMNGNCFAGSRLFGRKLGGNLQRLVTGEKKSMRR